MLMSAFALASVVGVPIGIYFGNEFGWNVPFLVLAGLGVPVLLGGVRALPPLREHLKHAHHVHPLVQIRETFSHPNHLRAFALILTLMLGGFAVIPYISVYLVANVGVPEAEAAAGLRHRRHPDARRLRRSSAGSPITTGSCRSTAWWRPSRPS